MSNVRSFCVTICVRKEDKKEKEGEKNAADITILLLYRCENLSRWRRSLSLSSFVQCAVSRFLHRLPPIARPMPTAEGGWGEEVGGKEEKLPVSPPPLLARKRKEVAEGREKKTKERDGEVSPPLFFR